jgi:hypothetical protein
MQRPSFSIRQMSAVVFSPAPSAGSARPRGRRLFDCPKAGINPEALRTRGNAPEFAETTQAQNRHQKRLAALAASRVRLAHDKF